MSPAAAARALTALGWLAGMALVLDGALIAALTVLGLALAGAVIAYRRGAVIAATVRTLGIVRRLRHEVKTGSALERA